MPTDNVIRFDDSTFRAARQAVLPNLVIVRVGGWGWSVEWHGSAAELIAAGLATAELFDIGKSGQRTSCGEFGDQYIVRRVRNKWTLMIRVQETMQWPSESTLDPNCKGYENKLDRQRWLEQGGAEAEAATDEILARFRR